MAYSQNGNVTTWQCSSMANKPTQYGKAPIKTGANNYSRRYDDLQKNKPCRNWQGLMLTWLRIPLLYDKKYSA